VESESSTNPPRRLRLWPWVLATLLVAFWFGHGPALEWGVRKALDYLDGQVGLQVDFKRIQVHLFRPIVLEGVRFRVLDPAASVTDATAARIELRTTSLWEMLFGDGRVLQRLSVEDIAGTFDFRTPAIVVQPLPTLDRAGQEQFAAMLLRFLPKSAEFKSCDAVFLADGQTYTLRDMNLTLAESSRGKLTFEYALIEAGPVRREIFDGEATTAWRDGVIYASDLALGDGVVIRNFVANFAHVGGVELQWDVGVEEGTFQGSVVFGSEKDMFHIDLALAAIDLPVKPLPGFLSLPGSADGVIRDGRITYRVNPEQPMDAEIALRLSAEDFRWNDHGWQSLVIGANYIGRRLYLSTLDLKQEDNIISLNGECVIPESLEQLPKSRFLLNLNANVRDLSALAGLAGAPFDQLGGRFSLHGSVSGESGNVDGYLNGEASGIVYGGLPPASARISLIAARDELQVRHAELWSGEDRISARGTIGLRRPHQYTGEVTGSIGDIGIYIPYAGGELASTIFTGAGKFSWQGDGTTAAHSGAFHVKLDNVITSLTPTGITGEFSGTYSPQNVYFDLVRLTHGSLDLQSKLTLAATGVNISNLSLKRGNLELLSGEAFVPLDPFAMAGGETLAKALNRSRPVYANFRSGELPIADLVQMAGQSANIGGRASVNISASGLLPELTISGSFDARNITIATEDFSVPATSINLDLSSDPGRLVMTGSLQTRGFDPCTITASMPFAFEETEDGGVRLFDHDAPISAKLSFPGTSLEVLRPFLPFARQLAGTLKGSATVAGTLSAPEFSGEASLVGGEIDISPDTPSITGLNAHVVMNKSRITLDSLRGAVGAGPFQGNGWIDFSNAGDPEIRFKLDGEKVLLARDPGLRLRANLDLLAQGRLSSGSITGSVGLVDGRIYRRLEVTPLLVQNPVERPAFVVPVVAGLVPEPFSNWSVDVSIRNAEPFLMVGNVATGEISPDLAIRGTLGAPYAAGTVYLRDVQAFLPATTLRIPEGRIHFTRERPFVPIMDVRARTAVAGYNVQMFAYGALTDSKLALRSDPPLSQENLIFLLTTGLTPAGMSNAGLGEAVAGQGGIILLRSIARQLEPFGIDLNEFVNRLSVRVIPPKDTSEESSLASELHLTHGFSLTSGRDGYGFYDAGVQYTIRFR